MSTCKTCKSVEQKLFLKGKKCFTSACPIEKIKKNDYSNKRRPNKPYLNQILEKRKILARYNIRFSQLKKYFILSKKSSVELDNIIESRLDNLVYRSGFAPNIRTSRQMISHGFVKINERKCNISSRLISQNDKLQITTDKHIFHLSEKPDWISVKEKEVKIIDLPKCEENFINFNIISDFLSRYV